ncbi:MAG: phosphatase PAP2-related protein [candidate division KSB1 bacterium]|nr:phosphatase PAP2-related protein [candidate division KSB1 bacterium]
MNRKIKEIGYALNSLFKNKYFYVGLLILIAGKNLNYYSQTYLHYYIQEGEKLPVLSDLILDNLPYWDIDYIYDIFMIVSAFVFIVYVIHKQQYAKIPYFLLLGGLFQLVREVFIILTPFGNPELFDGTQGPFNGFAKYELGVFPSGHTGFAYMYFLLVQNKYYRIILIVCVFIIISALFLSRGHYSIDVLSGIFFAYAIKSFGDKYLMKKFCSPRQTMI